VACPVVQAPSPLQTITPTAQYEYTSGSLSYSLGASDYVYAGLGAYSSLSGNLLRLGGYESPKLAGIEYGLPSVISDLPSAVVGVATVMQMTSQLQNGDVPAAIQTGGSGIGGIAGSEGGAEFGLMMAPPPWDVATSAIGAFIGGIGGSQFGGGGYGIGHQCGELGFLYRLHSVPLLNEPTLVVQCV
jgi:hypothetical protein